MSPRYSRRPPKKRVGKGRRSGGGGAKSGSCAMSAPLAAARLAVVLARLVLVNHQIGWRS